MRRVNDRANEGDLDPIRGDPARRRFGAAEDLVECEKACAQNFWPAAVDKPWIGEVALDMAKVPRDQLGGLKGR